MLETKIIKRKIKFNLVFLALKTLLMKKQLSILFILFLFTNGVDAQIKPGIGGSILFTNLSNKIAVPLTPVEKLHWINESVTGWKFGVNADIRVKSKIHFLPELNFLEKGSIVHRNDTLYSINPNTTTSLNVHDQFRLYYLELPLNLAYRFSFLSTDLLIGGGPCISKGVGGKIKTQSSQNCFILLWSF